MWTSLVSSSVTGSVVDYTFAEQKNEKLQQFKKTLWDDLHFDETTSLDQYIRDFSTNVSDYKYIRGCLKLSDTPNTNVPVVPEHKLHHFFNSLAQLPISKDQMDKYIQSSVKGSSGSQGTIKIVTSKNGGIVLKRMNESSNVVQVQQEVLLGMISHFYYPDFFVVYYGYIKHENQFYILTKQCGTDVVEQFTKSTPDMDFIEALTNFYSKVETPLRDLYIAHNDIKLDNTFIDQSTLEIKIGDFGLASFYGYILYQKVSLLPGQSTVGSTLYRDPYRAYEVTNCSRERDFYLRMLASTHRNDAYGLGMSVYYLLVGNTEIDNIRRDYFIHEGTTVLYQPNHCKFKAKVFSRDGEQIEIHPIHNESTKVKVNIYEPKVKLPKLPTAVKQDLFGFIKNEIKAWEEVKKAQKIPETVVEFIDDTVARKWQEFLANYQNLMTIANLKVNQK